MFSTVLLSPSVLCKVTPDAVWRGGCFTETAAPFVLLFACYSVVSFWLQSPTYRQRHSGAWSLEWQFAACYMLSVSTLNRIKLGPFGALRNLVPIDIAIWCKQSFDIIRVAEYPAVFAVGT